MVVAVVAVALVATRSDPDDRSAAERLEQAGEAMAEADSFRLESMSEDRSGSGDSGGAGSSEIYRTVTEAEVSGDEWHVTYDEGDWADESVGVAEGVYTRSATGLDGLAAEAWAVLPSELFGDVAVPTDDGLAAEFLLLAGLDLDGDGEVDPDVVDDELTESTVVPALAGLYLFGMGAPAPGDGSVLPLPTGLISSFGGFEDAEVASDAGGVVTIRAVRRAPTELTSSVGFDLPDGVFEITIGPDDLPTALTLTVEGDSARYTEQVTFSDWGAAIAIDPPEGEIDETPWLDEEALAEVRGTVAPLAPTLLPDGLGLVGIDAYPAEEAEAFGTEPCAQLHLIFEPPLADAAAANEWYSSPDYLDVYLLPAACALDYDDTPFTPGAYGDRPSRDSFGLIEILVGDTVVQFDTTYTADLPTMVASIQPFDLDAEVARTSALAEQTWAAPPGL